LENERKHVLTAYDLSREIEPFSTHCLNYFVYMVDTV